LWEAQESNRDLRPRRQISAAFYAPASQATLPDLLAPQRTFLDTEQVFV
jgi:hypothetical protein